MRLPSTQLSSIAPSQNSLPSKGPARPADGADCGFVPMIRSRRPPICTRSIATDLPATDLLPTPEVPPRMVASAASADAEHLHGPAERRGLDATAREFGRYAQGLGS